MSVQRGLVLLNLGTPDSPEPKDVGRYLREFLMDKWVVDIPWLARWALVNLAIVPRRKVASAHAYAQVWTERGSPLRFHSEDLVSAVRHECGEEFKVAYGMRYGNPSTRLALEALADCDQIVAIPLYPQYAESSSRSSIEETAAQAKLLGIQSKVVFIKSFYDDAGFIRCSAQAAREALAREPVPPDYFLFSFHGLPEAHVRSTDRSLGHVHCLATSGCCDQIVDANRDCYRAQCFATARSLAKELKLQDGKWSVSFQSRLGRRPWIKPYTDFVYKDLAAAGVRRIFAFCPSFVADCLETLEEIRIRGDEEFRAAGGESLSSVDCLNARPDWAKTVLEMARSALTPIAHGAQI